MQGGNLGFGMRPGGRFSMSQISLGALITIAYGIQRFQLIGGPSWLNSDRFDINAVAEDVPISAHATRHAQPDAAAPAIAAARPLRARRAQRNAGAPSLLPGDGARGSQARGASASFDGRLPGALCCPRERRERRRTPFQPPKPGEVPQCGMMGGFGRIMAGSVTMSNFASMLAGMLNRPVYDRTNLTGNFDIQIEYTPDQMPQIPAGVTLPPGLTTAVIRRSVAQHRARGAIGPQAGRNTGARRRARDRLRLTADARLIRLDTRHGPSP